MSALGAPDMGALSFGEILDRVRRICEFGFDPGDRRRRHRLWLGRSTSSAPCASFERAGVSAVQLEDQEWPKKLRPRARPQGGVVT